MSEPRNLAKHYTAPEWIGKKTPSLKEWPAKKQATGRRSRLASGGTIKAKWLLKRLGL